MKQLSRLVAFRQDIYELVFTKRCDAQCDASRRRRRHRHRPQLFDPCLLRRATGGLDAPALCAARSNEERRRQDRRRQVKELCRACAEKLGLDIIIGDGRYGNHRFLGALRSQTERGDCGLVVRLRSDRVLYGEAGPYGGRGRPRKHGKVFRFKEEATWPAPKEYVRFTDEQLW